jgi:hypothetical protein
VTIISDEFAATIAQSLPCDCDHSRHVEGMPHREWCITMTPLGVVKDIAGAAVRLALADAARDDHVCGLSAPNPLCCAGAQSP